MKKMNLGGKALKKMNALACALIGSLTLAAQTTHAAAEFVIDNVSGQATGSWQTSSYSWNYYGTNYAYSPAASATSSTFTWAANLPQGSYHVYYRIPNGDSNRNTAAVFTLNGNGTSCSTTVNEQTNPDGAWRPICGGSVVLGGNSNVVLSSASTSGYLIADAVKFVPDDLVVDNPAGTAVGSWTTSSFQNNHLGADYAWLAAGASGSFTWKANIPTPGLYNVYYRLPDGKSDRAAQANFSITGALMSKSYSVNEQVSNSGAWVLLDAVQFSTLATVTVSSAGSSGGILVADAVKFVPATIYTVTTNPRQTILGLGVEIQNDTIGSGNTGTNDPTIQWTDNTHSTKNPVTGVIPGDLSKAERTRLYTDLLSGFRYARLALGLYYRGVDPLEPKSSGHYFVERYLNQNQDLAELIAKSGIEGVDAEYWSPPPLWKSNSSLVEGGPNLSATSWGTFGDATVAQLNALKTNGIPVAMWGLQNEPDNTTTSLQYASCYYGSGDTGAQAYHDVFASVAPQVKAAFPNPPGIIVHATSGLTDEGGQTEFNSSKRPIGNDSIALKSLDGWSWHQIGSNADDLINKTQNYTSNSAGKMVFNDEFEYQTTSPYRDTGAPAMMNTAHSIMNWFAFEQAPTWFWLHALKPASDSNASGYALGTWVVPAATGTASWDYLPYNYNAVAGFLAHLPHNSVRYDVTESAVSLNSRVLAWLSPKGYYGIALTNNTGVDAKFHVNLPVPVNGSGVYAKYVYDGTKRTDSQAGMPPAGQYQGKYIGNIDNAHEDITVPNQSIVFLTEY